MARRWGTGLLRKVCAGDRGSLDPRHREPGMSQVIHWVGSIEILTISQASCLEQNSGYCQRLSDIFLCVKIPMDKTLPNGFLAFQSRITAFMSWLGWDGSTLHCCFRLWVSVHSYSGYLNLSPDIR